jgi:hypothetical protein
MEGKCLGRAENQLLIFHEKGRLSCHIAVESNSLPHVDKNGDQGVFKS